MWEPYRDGLLQKGLNRLPTPGYLRPHVYRPKNGGLLPPAGAGPHATAPGLLSPTEDGWIANRRCRVDFSGPPSRLFALLTREASECVHPLGLHTRWQQAVPTRPAIKSIQIQGQPPSLFPRALHDFCLRQSPPATFIEAAKSNDPQPAASLAPRTLPSRSTPNKERKIHCRNVASGKALPVPRRAGWTAEQSPPRVLKGKTSLAGRSGLQEGSNPKDLGRPASQRFRVFPGGQGPMC